MGTRCFSGKPVDSWFCARRKPAARLPRRNCSRHGGRSSSGLSSCPSNRTRRRRRRTSPHTVEPVSERRRSSARPPHSSHSRRISFRSRNPHRQQAQPVRVLRHALTSSPVFPPRVFAVPTSTQLQGANQLEGRNGVDDVEREANLFRPLLQIVIIPVETIVWLSACAVA